VEREAPDNGRTRVTRAARGLSTLAIAVSAGVWLASCGGGGGGGTPVTPTATPTPGPVRTVVAQGSYSLSAPEADGTTFFRRTRFETTRVGAFEVTVDWTYASNTVWMYLADGECTADQFASDECPGTYQAVLISSVAGVGALAHHPDYGGVAGRKRLPPSIRQ
jgi:hypothetical protein